MRAGRRLQPRQVMARGILLEHGDGGFRRRRIGIRIFRRAGADQVLVIQERTAERALEKIVGEHEFLAPRRRAPNGCSRSVPWRKTAGIGPGGIAIVLAAVDLHLMLEEAMPQIARHGGGRQRDMGLRREGMLDRERRIGQADALLLASPPA